MTGGGERRGSFLETAKERWNAEVLGAARWAQNKDWGRVREEAEEGVARFLGVELSKEAVTLGVADAFWRGVDRPVVRFGRWVEMNCIAGE